MQKTYLMIDIETLGTSPHTAPVMAIAAVFFTMEKTYDPYYAEISYADNIAHGRKPDIDTAIWWLGQETKLVMNSPITLAGALTELDTYLSNHKFSKDTMIYCRGTSFDPVILESIYTTLKIPLPWKYYQWNCVRTLAKHFQIKTPKNNHHALDDCHAQIETVRTAHGLAYSAGIIAMDASPDEILFGQVIRIGTFNIGNDTVTGAIIEIPKDRLETIPIKLYTHYAITPHNASAMAPPPQRLPSTKDVPGG